MRAIVALLLMASPLLADFTVGTSDPNVYQLGVWSSNSISGTAVITAGADSAQVAITCPTTTGVSVNIYSAQTMVIAVDGGSPSTYTAPSSGTFQFVNGPTGLSSGTHLFQISQYVGTGLYIPTASSITCIGTGSSTVSNSTFTGTSYLMNNSTLTGSSQIDAGGYLTTLASHPNALSWKSPNGILRFNANVTGIAVWASTNNATYTLFQDGTQIAQIDSYSTSSGTEQSWNFVTLDAPGSLTGTHTYEISNTNSNTGANYANAAWGIYALYLSGGSGFTGVKPTARNFVGSCGDSINYGGSVSSLMTYFDSTTVYTWQASRTLSPVVNDQHPGQGGAQVVGNLETSCATFTAFGASPSVTYLEGIVNDFGASNLLSTFQTAYQTMLTNSAGVANPPAHLVALAMFNNQLSVDARGQTVSQWRSTVNAAVNVYNAGSPTIAACDIDPSEWTSAANTGPSYDIFDSLGHLTPTGYAKVGNRLLPVNAGYISGASYTITGPSSGLVGTASTNFTVTYPGSGTWAVDQDGTARQTITLNDGGNGGTFTTSLATSGTGPLTTIIPGGTSSWTFTYTPVVSGVKSLSSTNNQSCWTNPSSLSYTANTTSHPPSVVSGKVQISGNAKVF